MNPANSEESTVGYYVSTDLDMFYLDAGFRLDQIERSGSVTDEDHGDIDYYNIGARWNFEISTKRLFNISIALVAVQIFLGAWTSTNYASYSCTDFPLCQGQILPEANFKEGFNFFQSKATTTNPRIPDKRESVFMRSILILFLSFEELS